jgi:enhancer of mRNA-decapping protein 3
MARQLLTPLVTCPAISKYVKEFTINAADIAELVEAPNEPSASQSNAPTPQVPTITVPENKFEDPAILSMGKKPTLANQPMPEFPQWGSTATERVDSLRTGTSADGRTAGEFPALTLVEPLQQIYISEVEANSLGDGLILDEKEPELSAAPPVLKTKRARKRKGHARKAAGGDLPEPDVTPAQETSKSKGWRQTPLLEPNPSFQPFATLKKNRAMGGGTRHMEENGWATEDATDVQDMGDFNFAESLAKFDKKTVFTQIQAEDNIADEDRLVAHNRLPRPKPGTAGGKNLHYTENVLEVPSSTAKTKNAPWRSEAGDSDLDERTSQMDTGSGRASRRAESKLAVHRRPISRLGSVTGGQSVRTISVSHPGKSSFAVWILPSLIGRVSNFYPKVVFLPCPIGSPLRTRFRAPDA